MDFRVGRQLVICAVLVGVCFGAAAENRVKARLVSNVESAEPGSRILVGVLFDIPERAHIYWRNPGDTGLATEVKWITDDTLHPGALQWPSPRSFTLEGLNETYFGYTRQVLLFSEFAIPKSVSNVGASTINAEVQWLLCLDDGVCIPEDQALTMQIPVQEESRKAYESTLFDRFSAEVPGGDLPGTVSWSGEGSTTLTIELDAGLQVGKSVDGRGAAFFPNSGGGWSIQDDAANNDGRRVVFQADYSGDRGNGGVLVLPVTRMIDSTEKVHYIVVKSPETP